MEKEKTRISYCVYDFMRGLGLNNSELKIYALIYAYRKSEAGFFFGRRKFIAEECSLSQRTVERVIPALIKRGLIEKIRCGELHGYACTDEYIPKITYGYDVTDEEEEAYVRTDIKPKYEMVTLGKYIIMTRDQCETLLALVPIRMLESYVGRMDRMLEKNMASGIHPPKSYYRTIKKWIMEDCAI